jgi:hypothetical protein
MIVANRKFRRHLLLSVAMSFLAGSCLFGQIRDYWLKTERRGTGFAYEHITVTRLPDGNLRYDYEQHIKTDVAGLNPQDITQAGHYVVTPALKPLALELKTSFRTKTTSIQGTRANDVLTLTVTEAGSPPEEREISVADTYFDVTLADLIFRKAGEKNFRLKFFNPVEIRTDEVRVAISAVEDHGWEAVVSYGGYTTRVRLDPDGQVREIILVELNGRTYRTDAEDARNITYLNTADGASLMVKSQKTFPNVFQVRRARIQVGWGNIPFEEFKFEDNRQKLAGRSASGVASEVVLEVFKPAAAPSPGTRAAEGPGPAYLGECEFIKPRDPAIQQQAAEIAGGEKDPVTLVRKILRWVNANVSAENIAETLTGPEVLRKKRGKCSEYSILFASLARAAGIPTRIALGELYSNGAWVGHMWDEVWLGEWTAADAAAGMFVAGPSHLKFIDSPTVAGTQALRWKLVDNLRIEILDFEEEPAGAGLVTGITGRVYANKDFACRIAAADETWTLREEVKSGLTSIRMKARDGGAEFALVFFAVPPGTSPKTVLKGRLNALGQMVKDFKLLEEAEWDVAGWKAPLAVFSQSEKAGGGVIVNQNVLLIDGARAYLFAFITPGDRSEELRPAFRKILDTFELVR